MLQKASAGPLRFHYGRKGGSLKLKEKQESSSEGESEVMGGGWEDPHRQREQCLQKPGEIVSNSALLEQGV